MVFAQNITLLRTGLNQAGAAKFVMGYGIGRSCIVMARKRRIALALPMGGASLGGGRAWHPIVWPAPGGMEFRDES